MGLSADYIVIGSGLTGATIARILADAGREVVVLEKREQVGGNVSDHYHESGVRIHTYGPHYFRTSSVRIWSFVHRFADFYPYEARLRTLVDGRLERWPVTEEYVARAVGDGWEPDFRGSPSSFEEASLGMMPGLVYEKFVKGYTEKQWGVPAHQLSPDLAKRFDVRRDDDDRLVQHKHQGLPSQGYTRLMESMLHGIEVKLKHDYRPDQAHIEARRKLIYTGPIDEFFGFDMGRLDYRGQIREHRYLPELDYYQSFGQINNPGEEGDHIRTLEWKHMMPVAAQSRIKGTVVTTETPFSPTQTDGYEYPFPDARNQDLYASYRKRVQGNPDLMICGRLGEYRYYDMDQAIGRAMKLAGEILREQA